MPSSWDVVLEESSNILQTGERLFASLQGSSESEFSTSPAHPANYQEHHRSMIYYLMQNPNIDDSRVSEQERNRIAIGKNEIGRIEQQFNSKPMGEVVRSEQMFVQWVLLQRREPNYNRSNTEQKILKMLREEEQTRAAVRSAVDEHQRKGRKILEYLSSAPFPLESVAESDRIHLFRYLSASPDALQMIPEAMRSAVDEGMSKLKEIDQRNVGTLQQVSYLQTLISSHYLSQHSPIQDFHNIDVENQKAIAESFSSGTHTNDSDELMNESASSSTAPASDSLGAAASSDKLGASYTQLNVETGQLARAYIRTFSIETSTYFVFFLFFFSFSPLWICHRTIELQQT